MKEHMHTIQKNGRHEKGQSLVEAALVLPIVIMLMLGMLDLGRAFFILVELNDAADEGATYAAIDYSDTTGIQARAVDAVSLVTIDPNDVVLTGPPSGAIGQPVTVTVGVRMAIFTPFVGELIGGNVLWLRGRATHPIMMLP